MWELFWAGAEMSALKKTAFVTKLANSESTSAEYARGR